MAMSAERSRVTEVPRGRAPWRRWGPYLSERAWGTVREDYSADGNAWDYFPHDHARSRAYRWNEDGLAGICDDRQYLCFALAMWNGQDPIIKERIFGLTGHQGNHGEDAKEYWWYVDSTPTHSWMQWQYVYPQRAFPYEQLIVENARRGRSDPEFELEDTGIFDGGRYWVITAEYAKATPEDIAIRIWVHNEGPEDATIDILPTLWFRNTWSWGRNERRPQLRLEDKRIVADHYSLGRRFVTWEPDAEALFCENETNFPRLWGSDLVTPYPKDGINDHIVQGAATVNPDHTGTKAALRFHLVVPAGGTAVVRLRLSDSATGSSASIDETLEKRRKEADQYYEELLPNSTSQDEKRIARQAFAGLLWSKQFYHYSVEHWLEGDPTFPPPPAQRWSGRNVDWRHLNNRDVISMPDKWEYPWYAAWDLAFHCIALAHVDPALAKDQLLFLCREWYMHPAGQLPAYEWSFGDVNPPVHAYAALRVFTIDGAQDYDFLERIFHKLLINFTWWVNRKDREGSNIFAGGFLGLDNIGPFDRGALPPDHQLEQSDGTAWMAMYCLSMLELSLQLANHDDAYEDIATKFFEHFAYIAVAMNDKELWNEQDGFYYDVLKGPDGRMLPLRARSIVGLVPLFAVTVLDADKVKQLPDFAHRIRWFTDNAPRVCEVIEHVHLPDDDELSLLSVANPERLRRLLIRMLDESEFLSPYGIRSLSRYHLDHPLEGTNSQGAFKLDYEPGESTTRLFGGNSNWRGPVWFPINYLAIAGLRRFHTFFGDIFTVECPTGSGIMLTLDKVADELERRLIALFVPRDGKRPTAGGNPLFEQPGPWSDNLLFNEYFHGDTGKGLGATHQTGWTSLVADLILSEAGMLAPITQPETPR
ncbi:MAG: glucosidase [Chloroflexi bacterium]|nr:glucosidase [Chloroflexota bacterium]